MGFFAPPQPNQRCEFNRQNVFYIVKNTWMFVPVTAFLFFEAKSYYEFSLSFYMIVVVFTMVVFCAVTTYKYGLIVMLVGKYEDFAKARKQH